MVELMVALVISLLISLAAISTLIVARQGFTTVDASSQLRDNARFTADLIQRIGVQAGYKSDLNATAAPPSLPEPDVFGFNNALTKSSDPLHVFIARTTTDGSDVLILRYQPTETFPTSGVSDGSMIDCAGNSPAGAATGLNDRFASIFSVGISNGEPSLLCTTVNPDGSIGVTNQPVVQGVENFQVLYGIDNGLTSPTAGAAFAGTANGVPNAYLRADQLCITGDTTCSSAASLANWRRVRSLRIGMVLRGPPNSQQGNLSQTFYPLGSGKSSSTGGAGTALSSTNDTGTIFSPTADGRLRLVSSFTVHLRNDQSF